MNSSFSKLNPLLQLAWDSTSLGMLKECPRKYYYSMILNYTGVSDNYHLKFGVWYHKALELYDKDLAMGLPQDKALFNTVKWLLEATVVEVFFHDCKACGVTANLATKHSLCPSCQSPNIEVTTHRKLWETDDAAKTRFTLVRTVVWYIDQFQEHPMETVILANGQPAIELSFRFEPGWTSSQGEEFVLCGHLDKIGKLGDMTYGMDRKTTKSTLSSNYFAQYTPDNQMSLYSVAGKVIFGQHMNGMVIDAAQIAVNFTRFDRGFAERTDDQLEEWMQDTRTWLGQAERYAELGQVLDSKEPGASERAYPQNDKSCHNYSGCQFRGICSKSAHVRKAFLASNFQQRVWDPLENR